MPASGEPDKKDPGQICWQVGMLNADGEAAALTGERCIEVAGHYVGKGHSVQANLMEKATVWPAMAITVSDRLS